MANKYFNNYVNVGNVGVSEEPAETYNKEQTENVNLITSAGITISDTDLEQKPKSVAVYSVSASYLNCSGSANAYTLNQNSTLLMPPSLFDGAMLRFYPNINNTGSSTLTIGSYTTKLIVKEDGSILISGDLKTSELATVIYSTTNNRFTLLSGKTATTTRLGTSYLQTNFNRALIAAVSNDLDPNNDIDLGGGLYDFDDGSGQAKVTAMTKQLNAVWAAGTNAGFLHTGTKAANKFYDVYVIYNPTTATSDYICVPQGDALTLPTDYTKKNYIFSFLTDGSANIRQFYFNGKLFSYTAPITDFTGTTDTTAGVLQTISVPQRKLKAFLHGRGYLATGTGTVFLRIWSPLQSDGVVTSANCICASGSTSGANAAAYGTWIYTENAQVRKRASASMDATTITVSSYELY